MYPLVLVLVAAHLGAAQPWAQPWLTQPWTTFTPIESLYPGVYRTLWPNTPAIELPNFYSVFNDIMDMKMPATGPREYPSYSTKYDSYRCQRVSDVKDLKFPPYSEVPKEKLNSKEVLQNEVTYSTYLCKGYSKPDFYMLRTHATFQTYHIHNEQNTTNFYTATSDHKPLYNGKDFNVDQKALWDEADEDYKNGFSRFGGFPSYTEPKAYWPSSYLVKPWSWHEQSVPAAPTCETRDRVTTLKYPEVEDTGSPEGKRETNYETSLCTDSNNNKYYLLRTNLTITGTDRSVLEKYKSFKYAADSDGKPTSTTPDATNEGQSYSRSSEGSSFSRSYSTGSSNPNQHYRR